MPIARASSWLLARPTVAGILYLSSGVAGSQLVTLCAMPLLTRLYDPNAIGAMTFFLAVLAVAAPVAAFAYPAAIVLAKSDRDASALSLASFMLAVLPALVIGIGGSFLIPEDAQLGGIDRPIVAWLLALACFFSACHQIVEQLALRSKKFQAISGATFVQSLLANTARIGAGFYSAAPLPLVAVAAAMPGVHALTLWRMGRASVASPGQVGWRSLVEQVRYHRDFPLYRAPQVLMNSLSHSLPALLLGAVAGTGPLGLFALAKTVVDAPSVLLGKAISDVTYSSLARTSPAAHEFKRSIMRRTLVLAVVGLFPLLIAWTVLPNLLPMLFGARWAEAGAYTQWLAVATYFYLVARPCVAVIPILKLQKKLLAIEIGSIALRLCAFLGAWKLLESNVAAVAGFACASAVIYAAIIRMTLGAVSVQRNAG